MSAPVGYILTGPSGEIRRYGGTWGSMISIPNPVVIDALTSIYGMEVGVDYNGYSLSVWEMDDPGALPVIVTLVQVIAAQLQVVDGELTGIDRSQGIVGGFTDGDTAYIYFTDEQPDTDYVLLPSDGFTKFTDHVELTRPGLTTVAFVIQRVQ